MRPTIFLGFILALILPPLITAGTGYRHLENLDHNELTSRFAEYDAPGCVDLWGNEKEDYKDYSPIVLQCYDIKNESVSMYHERGYMSEMWLYPEFGCTGEPHKETDWSCCQPIERRWKPNRVRSYRMR